MKSATVTACDYSAATRLACLALARAELAFGVRCGRFPNTVTCLDDLRAYADPDSFGGLDQLGLDVDTSAKALVFLTEFREALNFWLASGALRKTKGNNILDSPAVLM